MASQCSFEIYYTPISDSVTLSIFLILNQLSKGFSGDKNYIHLRVPNMTYTVDICNITF